MDDDVEAFEMRPNIVEGAARFLINGGADARTFRPEQAAVRADRLDQQAQRFLRIEHRVKVKTAHSIHKGEALSVRAGNESADLIGNGAPTV